MHIYRPGQRVSYILLVVIETLYRVKLLLLSPIQHFSLLSEIQLQNERVCSSLVGADVFISETN